MTILRNYQSIISIIILCVMLSSTSLTFPLSSAAGRVLAADSGIPTNYIGTWRGATTVGGSWTISLALVGGTQGTVVGTIAYPSLNCGGKLSLTQIAGDSIKLFQDIVYGNCVDEMTVILKLTDENALYYEESYPNGQVTGSGTVIRTNGNDSDLPTPYTGVWEGSAVQFNPNARWPILMTLSGGSTSTVVGIAGFAPYRCGAELTLLSTKSNSVELLEDVTYGSCWDLGVITLTPNPDGTLTYQWRSPDNSSNATGSVERISQSSVQPSPLPFLELPYDYTNSSFAKESEDTEQGGKVNSYFDHQYPTYCNPPNTGGCSSGDNKAVNFNGYDSGQTNPPSPYKVAYNGHDGIDYLLGQGTPVLAAALGTATAYQDPCTGNTIKVQHDNGYVTLYYHLSAFPAGIKAGNTFNVTRNTINDMNGLVGYVGKTGSCSGGAHLHFLVRNPSGVQVDPYSWKPRPGAAWYGKTDPWQQYKADNGGIDATSYYLWKQPSEFVGLVPTSGSLAMTLMSGQVKVTVPSNVYNGALRIDYRTETMC